MKTLPIAKTNNILVQELKDETLLYNLETNQVYCLNKTAAFVWQSLDGQHNLEQIKQLSKYNLDDELIFLTIDEFNRNNLLQEKLETNLSNEKMNRRTLLAKYGAMAIALPLITTIAAPKSIQAQSCVDRGPLSVINPGPANCVDCPAINATIANALACCPGTNALFFGCDSIVCTYGCIY
jgi:Coenzyme PQQ synthesis protein D (PqqD)